MNTAHVNGIQVDGSAAGPVVMVTAPTDFTSSGRRSGVDPAWSIGSALGVSAPQFGSTGQRSGVDPGQSSGRGL